MQETESWWDLNEGSSINLSETDFNMGFGYYGSGKKFNKNLDPMIGDWSIEHRTKTKIEDENGMISFEKNSTVYDVQSCSENPGAWNTSA